jgi:pilus assembly protein CpaC
MRQNRLLWALVAMLGAFAASTAARAAEAALLPADSESTVPMEVGRSAIVESSWPIKGVSISDPKIADIQALSPKRVIVSAKAIGTVDLIVWDDAGDTRRTTIVVGTDLKALSADLKGLFPDAALELHQSEGVLTVSGTVNHADEAERLHKLLDSYGVKYVDMTRLAGVQQVQIKVIIAETNRTAIRSLGVNMFQNGSEFIGGQQVGPDLGGAINPITVGSSSVNVSPNVSLFGDFPKAQFLIFVQALAENQYLRVLAEPSLVALSGEEASFLAGGEFPIPIAQGAGAGTSGNTITVTYKEFGVRLQFRPTVLGDGSIRLHVAPEVSELSNSTGAVQLEGFNIPGILTRKAETTVVMNSGQTFAMAGLISKETQARSSRVPGLGELPVLGTLFRSVRYQQGDTELLVLITASLVEPLNVTQTPPAPGFTEPDADDWDLYALGRVDGRAVAKLSADDASWLKQSGLQRLRGPGAWAEYDGGKAASQAPAHAE